MTNLQFKNEETQAIHAGWRADASTNSVAVPIYQTTSYQFNDSSHAENLFAFLSCNLPGILNVIPQCLNNVFIFSKST